MRKTISGLIATLAVMAAGAAPASACDTGCSPCGYVSPCGAAYAQPYYGYAGYERLPNPEVQYHHPVAAPQYYYVEQGPTYTGPGDLAPRRVYREEGIYGWGYRHHHAYRHYPWHHHYWHRYGYHYRPHVLHSYY
jgi:hypothetical protein